MTAKLPACSPVGNPFRSATVLAVVASCEVLLLLRDTNLQSSAACFQISWRNRRIQRILILLACMASIDAFDVFDRFGTVYSLCWDCVEVVLRLCWGRGKKKPRSTAGTARGGHLFNPVKMLLQ
jgi:hypothetical protein